MTITERREMIWSAIKGLEWMDEFDLEGDPRYHDEERAVVAMCDRLGVIPVRDARGKIDGYGPTSDNLHAMIVALDRKGS